MFGLQWRDQLPGVVCDELDSLIAKLTGFLSVSHNDDGTLIPTAATTGTVPVGGLTIWTTNVIPNQWLLCDGSAVSRINYKGLFDVIGVTYGVGDGVLSFNLPNLVQRFPIGKANSGPAGTLGATGGSFGAGAATTSNDGAHVHTVNGGGHQHGVSGIIMGDPSSVTIHAYTPGGSSVALAKSDHLHALTGTVDSDGGHAHTVSSAGNHTHTVTVDPPYLSLNYIIFVG